MNPFEKQKSHNSNISRIYNFENSNNGGLGPGFFIEKFINRTNRSNIIINIIEKKFDLSIHIVLYSTVSIDLINSINNIANNLDVQKYIVTSTNVNSIQNNIINDKNNKFIIVDSRVSQDFTSLNIPYIIYDINNISSLINSIQSKLFSKIEEKLKI